MSTEKLGYPKINMQGTMAKQTHFAHTVDKSFKVKFNKNRAKVNH